MAFVSPIFFPAVAVQMLVGVVAPSLVLHPTDYHKIYPLSEKLSAMIGETGYMHLQATKPDTVGKVFSGKVLAYGDFSVAFQVSP